MTTPIDPQALATHLEGLRRLARSLVRDEHEADDVIQDAAVVALQSEANIRRGPRAWLAGVTRTKARHLARGAGRRRRHEQAAAQAGVVPSTEELALRAAEQSRLLDFVARMEDPYREALLLRYIEGLPPRDIAARLEIPVETVRTRVKRGLARLRSQLDEAHAGDRAAWHALLVPMTGLPGAAPVAAGLAVPALVVVGVLLALLGFLALFEFDGAEDKATSIESAEESGRNEEQDGAGDALPFEAPSPAQETFSDPGTKEEPKEEARVAEPTEVPVPGTDPAEDAASTDPGASESGARESSGERARRPAPPGGSIFAYSDNGYAQLDPAHASLYRINDERLIVAIQECLTTLDPATGKARPGAAESWSVDAEGSTWTFKLRRDAVWSDGSPVTSKDFVRGWRRVMDPFTKSEWSWLYRPIKDCGVIRDASARTEGLSELRTAMRQLLGNSPNGITGEDLNLALDDTGVRPFLVGVKSRSVKRLLKWKDGDMFPPESAKKVIDAIQKERRQSKGEWEARLDVFGKQGSGMHPLDDHTLVVITQGDCPYLPELVARSAFAPLHRSINKLRGSAFEVGGYVNNGPFLLKGRGSKPQEGQQSERVMSVVELVRNPKYNGPNQAKVERILCKTDLSLHVPGQEDLFLYERGKLQWVNATWPEWPKKKLRKKMEAMKGFSVRETPRVLFLRFRCDRKPFSDRDARKAFALSIDRAACAARFWPKASPAYRLVPTGIAGRTEGISCPKTNAAGAKAAFKSAGLDTDTWVETSYGEAPGQDEVVRTLMAGWKKMLGIEPGLSIQSDDDVRNVIRAGRYYVMLTEFRGAVNDPAAYLEPLHSGDADSGLGWRDEAYDALIDASRDPKIALEDPGAWLATVGEPSLMGALDAAKSSRDGRLRFRREVLAAAERRLLEEFVVVPILFLKEAALLQDATGIGSEDARRNPGFVGSLVSVER